MNLYQTKLFTTLQKEYKNKYGVDISQFVKLTNSSINFDKFEEKQLTLKQKNVIKSIKKNNEKKIILSGGIASGKTYLACYLFLKSLIENKKLYSSDTNNFIIGNSQRSVEVNVLGQFEKLCKLLKIPYIPRHTNNSYILIDSLRINLYGGDKASDFERFRGSNSALIFVNEATTLHKQTLEEVLKRLRCGQETIIFDTNPDHPEHYFKTDYIDNIATFKTYNFTTYDNVLLSKGFIETQEKLYKDIPSYKARVLLGEWIASTDSIFTQINITDDYVFASPIAYLDPAFSVGGDNTALCVMERVDDKYYAFVFQDQRPANDPYIMNMVKTVLENFNVHTLYLEDRDNTKGAGGLTREYILLRNNISQYFRIVPVTPKSNKFSRITTLITPFAYKKLYITKYSSSTVFNDIYSYKGDSKTHDDALDAMSAAYLMLSLGYRERSVHFGNQRFL
ncbi:PBSX family phage terminase large subunit [Borreliella burgdorferi]|uniref:PBSX family phage terminase large subunit n=1 Tax=Borreliella burgdorferi TaxID=139 RepID=UPI00016C582C|nr:PBSX family phage terminase large subunit [Borreliella burgdorferi]ACM10461.1 phage terminase, large subunit, pbsx family [Borreliella burgdorferi 72a]PRQ97114.1 PBSX family phage terminase large subunit [Borreliella burgdorferi]